MQLTFQNRNSTNRRSLPAAEQIATIFVQIRTPDGVAIAHIVSVKTWMLNHPPAKSDLHSARGCRGRQDRYDGSKKENSLLSMKLDSPTAAANLCVYLVPEWFRFRRKADLDYVRYRDSAPMSNRRLQRRRNKTSRRKESLRKDLYELGHSRQAKQWAGKKRCQENGWLKNRHNLIWVCSQVFGTVRSPGKTRASRTKRLRTTVKQFGSTPETRSRAPTLALSERRKTSSTERFDCGEIGGVSSSNQLADRA